MGVKRRGAIRADDPQIFEPVIVVHPVDVIEDHAHHLPVPDLILATELADRMLYPSLV